MKVGKTELKRRLKDNLRKGGFTDQKIDLFIDSLWRDPASMRTSGFAIAGGTDAAITWDDATREFLIAPVDAKFAFYSFRYRLEYQKKYTPQTIIITEAEGFYTILFSQNADTKEYELSLIQNPDEAQEKELYLRKVIVASVYWNDTDKQAVYVGDERHGSEWNPQIHWFVYKAFNMMPVSGLKLTGFNFGDGTQASHAQVSVQAGKLYHEDMEHTFDAVAGGSDFPILWFSGVTSLPRIDTNTSYAFLGNHVNLPRYNDLTTGTTIIVNEGSYVLAHFYASNCLLNPVLAVAGTAQYQSKNDAVLAAKSECEAIEALMPHSSRYRIGSVILHASGEYTNTARARLIKPSNSFDYISYEDGDIDKIISEIIAEETVPFLKTGWHPQVQSQVNWLWEDGTRVLNISAVNSYFSYWLQGIRTDRELDLNKQISDDYGMHYIYIADGGIGVTTTQWDNSTDDFVFVADIFWNPELNRALYIGFESHNYELQPNVRGNRHRKVFTEYISGLGVSVGSNPWQINVENGVIQDEDVIANIMQGSGGFYKVFLRALFTHKCYLVWSNLEQTYTWKDDIAVINNIVKLDASNNVEYNAPAGNGYELQSLLLNEYTVVWVLATMDIQYPVKIILGTAVGTDIDTAKENNPVTSLKKLIDAYPFFCEEYVLLSRIVVKNIADSPYYEIAELEDFRDTDLNEIDNDIYVDDGVFEDDVQLIRLKRTKNLPDVTFPFLIYGKNSIVGDGSSVTPFQLHNDKNNPGQLMVYATNANGIKGWWPLFGSGSSQAGSGSGSGTASGSGASGGGPGSGLLGSGSALTDALAGLIKDNYVTGIAFDDTTRVLTLSFNNDLPVLSVTIPGGAEVSDGQDGESAFVYIAYASDASGTGFTTTYDVNLDYIAILSTNTEIVSPSASDFTSLWKNYKGEKGDQGEPGEDGIDGATVDDFSDSSYEIVKSFFALSKESFYILSTVSTTETQLSSWSVSAQNEKFGNFKATVVISDKTTFLAVTLQNSFGFDYTDPLNPATDDNEIVTDSSVSLALSVDTGAGKLKAVVTGMAANDKRIHFCFERCANQPHELSISNVAAKATVNPVTTESNISDSLDTVQAQATANDVAAETVDPIWADAFITEWNMTDGDFTLPLAIGDYDFIVDWGDGSPNSAITSYNDPSATHSFTAGTYQIKIAGLCEYFRIDNNAAIRDKLMKIIQWGDIQAGNGLNMFYGCSNLSEIPDSPITGMTGVTYIRRFFRGCPLTSVPADLLSLMPNLSNLTDAFYDTALTSIPSGFFDINTSITTLLNCFMYSPIQSVPAGLLDNLTELTSVNSIFRYCPLTSISSGLFHYNTKLTNAGSCFSSSNLAAIPSDLFINNTLLTTVDYAFYRTQISSIPSTLFDTNPLITSFYYTFAFCNNITSIPAGLFDNVTNAANFGHTFRGLNIQSIPDYLFYNNLNAYNFYSCFSTTDILSIPPNLFNPASPITTFKQTFFGCGSLASNVPELWNIFSGTVTEYGACFRFCTNALNYADIPQSWIDY